MDLLDDTGKMQAVCHKDHLEPGLTEAPDWIALPAGNDGEGDEAQFAVLDEVLAGLLHGTVGPGTVQHHGGCRKTAVPGLPASLR